ncbi:4-hydroxybenzoate polyprenyl transferase [Colletotrichum graminicola]|uniref:Diterpenoid pyrone biosynthesis cluster protein C n=1 Tax=Colletotrichum graminicola (strain M1.001 / M2 / FGSC 10212) TaxID=645133 RepID=E3QIC9_COLGM|nr:4-hydroxybenzoate polyprenyl transferase [Colletotrichum graminicola M1.001]EFQ30539.1 4-hydroxybenzoate polyprenyl transferase [Colletotrichum graminicola M1.001]WDK21242.1 4-hydroxybenzoate polyprenyl transferase [Colletotrichum graminicola]
MDEVKGYNKPTHGIFRFLPDAWVPFAELMRLDSQAGFWAFYWHYLIGLGFAINIPPFSHDIDLKTLGFLAAYLGLWTTVFRGITCTWNDNMDQDFDRQVARCRVRPIPRGAVTTEQAHLFTAIQTAVGTFILYLLGDSVLIHAAIDGALLFIYPFLKRCTNYPQVELGFGLSYAIFLVTAIVGKDPLSPLLDRSLDLPTRVHKVIEAPLARSAACLYVAGIIWTVIFDTIYAHQDYLDDLKAGVKGLAVRLGRKGTKPACYMATAVQVYFLVLAGQLAGFGAPYYTISCGVTALLLARLIWAVDLEDGDSCAWAFGPGSGHVGTAIFSGLLADFFSKKYGS